MTCLFQLDTTQQVTRSWLVGTLHAEFGTLALLLLPLPEPLLSPPPPPPTQTHFSLHLPNLISLYPLSFLHCPHSFSVFPYFPNQDSKFSSPTPSLPLSVSPLHMQTRTCLTQSNTDTQRTREGDCESSKTRAVVCLPGCHGPTSSPELINPISCLPDISIHH